jgi:hypothetical protein
MDFSDELFDEFVGWASVTNPNGNVQSFVGVRKLTPTYISFIPWRSLRWQITAPAFTSMALRAGLFEINHYLVIDNFKGQGFKAVALAGPREAIPGFDAEGRAVQRAQQELTVVSQKIIVTPVQGRPGMRADITVGVADPVFLHHKTTAAFIAEGKFGAARFQFPGSSR